MHYGWTSPTLPVLKNGTYKIKINSTEASWLVIMPLIGAIFGAITTGFIIDHLGRKRLILFSSLPFLASWLMIAFAENSIILFVARFIAGIFDGLSFTAVPMYLGEIAEPEIRGLLSSMCPVAIVFGLFLVNVLGNYLTIPETAFIAAAIPIILLLTFVWMPESPYFYLMKGRTEEARKSLVLLRGRPDVESELRRLEKAVQEQNCNTGKFLDLFTCSSNRKAILIALGTRTVQQLTGINAIIYYCKSIFQESANFMSPGESAVILVTVQLVLSGVSSAVVDFFGRRPLLIFSLSGTILSLLISGTYVYIKNCTSIDTSSFDFVLLLALLAFIVIFSLGLQTVPLLLISEVFPTNVKAFALGLADVYFSIISSLVSKYFSDVSEAFGMHVPFYTFAVCCSLGLIFIIIYVPETKGHTLEDIQKYLRGEIVKL